MYEVYLAVHNVSGYVGEVFDNERACWFWCSQHPEYHQIIRLVWHFQPRY